MIKFPNHLSRFRCRPARMAAACLICFLSALIAPVDLLAQGTSGTTDETRLEPARPIQLDLSGGQSQKFRLDLAADQYAKLQVKQQGIDVLIRFVDPSGQTLNEVDADPRMTGTESAEIAASAASTVSIIVESKQKGAVAGKFEIELSELRAANRSDIDLDDARRSIYQATGLWRSGKFDEALATGGKAVEICRRVLGENSLEFARALFVIANVDSDNGNLDTAAKLYRQVIGIRQKFVDKDDWSMTPFLNNYAAVLKDKGDYPEAIDIFERVLAIRKKFLPPNHLAIASACLNLGNTYRLTGNISKAGELYQQALQIRKNALPPDHPDIATTLNNIANLYADPQRSEPLYKEALAIREKAFGPDSQEVAQTLYNLATLYADSNDLAKAESSCIRSLTIYENKLGKDHYLTSYPTNLLGGIYRLEGKFGEAKNLYERAIAIKEKAQGSFHPDLAGVLVNLAELYAAIGDMQKAVETQARANEIYEFNTSLNLTVGSEREKLEYLNSLNEIQDQTLTLNLAANRIQAATDLGLTSILRRKGRVLDAMSESMRALRGRLSTNDQAVIAKLKDTTTKLVSLVVNGPPAGDAESYRTQLTSLESEREEIENKIARLGAGYFPPSRSVTVAAVKAAIPADAALLEFAVYRPSSTSSSNRRDVEKFGPARYAAYVVHRNGDAKWTDLGNASSIDDAIRDLRNALRDPKRKDEITLSRKLSEKVMGPLRPLIGNSTHLLISPDGELNLMPFEALADQNGRFLIEDFRITYLTSGRDLLRFDSGTGTSGPPLIVANPAYGTAQPVAQLQIGEKAANKRTADRGPSAARSISDTYFSPLAGTAQEAQAIKGLFPEATLLEGAMATKASLQKAKAPRLLHIATHGFFLADQRRSEGDRGVKAGSKDAQANLENPLVRSGLALAGANRRDANKNEGIMSALEASGLDLWGTKLVVLSACDTGIGEVKTGEGVYGLRRSFLEAGAESLVMSLWPVSDTVTRELMIGYYKNLKQGMGRGDSLRQVQLEMLKRPDRRHPFYWASFIQAGDWRSLDEGH